MSRACSAGEDEDLYCSTGNQSQEAPLASSIGSLIFDTLGYDVDASECGRYRRIGYNRLEKTVREVIF